MLRLQLVFCLRRLRTINGIMIFLVIVLIDDLEGVLLILILATVLASLLLSIRNSIGLYSLGVAFCISYFLILVVFLSFLFLLFFSFVGGFGPVFVVVSFILALGDCNSFLGLFKLFVAFLFH